MNKDVIIQLINDRIGNYQQEVEKIMAQNCSTFEKYKQLFDFLEDDYSNITAISVEEIEDVLQNISLLDSEREEEFKNLKTIRSLLELNQTKQTTFRLSDKQKNVLELFKKQLKQLEKKSKVAVKKDLDGTKMLNDKIKKLKSLLGKVEDSKNMDYILEDTVLNDLLSSFDEEEQKSILYFVLKYNHSIYHERMNQKELDEMPRLNIEEVKELFKDYGYEFTDLNSEGQDYLLTYGQINRIREIFDCLQKNHFPRFDLKRNGKKLIVILVNGDTQTIEDVVSFSEEKGISPATLLLIIPAMIKQSKNQRKEVRRNWPFIIGRGEDYKKNIEFLEKHGVDILFVVQKCIELLIMSNAKLESNYHKFEMYDFEIKKDDCNSLCHPALNCLLANTFDEIVDQFIEISKDGHQYIKNHIGMVSTITSPHDLLFYNVYASYMNQDETGNVEGPFVDGNQGMLELNEKITRYPGSSYEDVPYCGVTETNKKEKTMTVNIECANKDEFDKAVEKHRGYEEKLYNLVFNDDVVLALEKYVNISNPLQFNFDGVLISKPKVLRIFNILKNEHLDALDDSLFYAITYNSILNQEAIDKIKHIIGDRRK